MITLFRKYSRWTFIPGAIILAGVFFGAGWLTGVLVPPEQPKTESARELRQRGYQFINPLLECESGNEAVSFTLLHPFHDKVERFVQEQTERYGLSHVAVYFRDLNNGPWFGIREQEHFTPASLLKLPVVIAALKQAENDPTFLDRIVRNDLVEDHTALQVIRPRQPLVRGGRYPLGDLIRLAITQSDNNAQHLLFREVDPQLLMSVFRDLGVPAPKLAVQYDFLSPRAYSSLFRILFNASYLSKRSSQLLLEYLAQSEFREGLVAGVPDYVLVAHKFGEYAARERDEKQLHDCGIVYYPGRPYLLCVMSRGKDFRSSVAVIRDISRLVYDEIDQQQRKDAKDGSP